MTNRQTDGHRTMAPHYGDANTKKPYSSNRKESTGIRSSRSTWQLIVIEFQKLEKKAMKNRYDLPSAMLAYSLSKQGVQ